MDSGPEKIEMKDGNRPTLVLVDGSNYVFRAFYAIRELTNSRGFPTNAVYGFTTMLMKLLKDHRPDYIAVAFDVKGPTFRHEAFDAYKATRRPTPDALLPQIPVIREVVRAFNIPVLEKQGVEADDLIGTLARRHAAQGLRVLIVSGDKDMMQLVSDDVVMVDTMRDKTFDATAVRERFGVDPDRVVEMLGLMGDATDNIPGVPGIGPKGAQRLLEQFGTIEAMLARPEKIYNARMREAVLAHAEQARLSRELAVIRTDVPVELDLEACRYTGPDAAALKALFQEYEFHSLIRELELTDAPRAVSSRLVRSGAELEAFREALRGVPEIAIDAVLSVPEAMRAAWVGLAVSTAPDRAFYLPLMAPGDGEAPMPDAADILAALAPVLTDPAVRKHGHDLKTALIVLERNGIALAGIGCDTLVAAYLLNPGRRGFELAEIADEHLHRSLAAAKEIVGSGARAVSFAAVPAETLADYAGARCCAVRELAGVLMDELDRQGFRDLFADVEMPLTPVLADMERHGVLLDVDLLRRMSQETEQLMTLSEEKIYRLAGERFNVNSPKQLQVILFERLGLPKGRRTKEGYSTDVDVLNFLARSHELPAEILAYRSMAKLKSTYIDALPQLVHPETGRVHTSYNQTVTATGRLSSSNPNLQNIPVRTLEGKRIRQAFIAPPGWCIVSADYSQIELRVLAHLSGDENLLDAFASGADIHSRTAADVFGVFPEMVNPEMRRQAKVINFGVLYGMSAFGLARELDITQRQAQLYIDGYFRKYAGVRVYLDAVLEGARRDGYVSTLLNRRRYLPEIVSPNATVRQFAERMAVNTPIQGTAADLIKIAMIRIHRRLKEAGLAARMIMQVHDELVCEVPAAEREVVTALLKAEMEGVAELRVPLPVEIGFGANWDEAHGG